jgi:hypothetical protein
MPDKTLDERMNAPTPRTIISEAIDYIVDFEVKETARERADRRWGMDERKASQ